MAYSLLVDVKTGTSEAQMKHELMSELQNLFGEDVNFDRVERKLYSHDVGSIPSLVKPLMPGGVASAVVRPKDEEQLVALAHLAGNAGIELVPRGAATSGYGGAIPREGAVVVDMRRFKKIRDIDTDNETVVAGAGVVWQHLATVLEEHGLALRAYPTSAPSSTVAGWLAQGGAGFGSYQYGWFSENVVSARVVLPSGEVKVFEGPGLSRVADAEGMTGFITEVKLRVRKAKKTRLFAAAFPDADSLQKAVTLIREQKLDIWSLSFLNPAATRLGKKMPAKTHHGRPIHATHSPLDMPEQYILLAAWSSDDNAVQSGLERVASDAGGSALEQEIAQHEWEMRFKPMRVKRLGPSLIPAEVVVPADRLGEVLRDLDDRIELPMIIEGMGVAGDEVVLLGFIPHDERKFGFNVAFALALSVVKAAREHGGRAYSTGIYFKKEAPEILGAAKVRELSDYKNEIDPNGVMNPGKVYGKGTLSSLLSAGESFEALTRSLGNSFGAPLGETFEEDERGLPAEVVRFAYACGQCGYCVEGCTQYSGQGWESHSPRGKWYFLREVLEGREKITQEWVTKFLLCTTCERCENECPLDLPIEPAWGALRGRLINDQGKMTLPPFEMMAASMRKEGNIWAAYREGRADWLPEEIAEKIPEKSKIGYFAGCTASFVEEDIGQGTVTLLDRAGVDFTYLGEEENCCGIPMLVSGRWDVWEENMKQNIANMKARGVETVVTSCPACYLVWKTYYPEWAEKLGIDYPFQAKHYSEVVAEKIAEGGVEFPHEVPMTVTFHDSCHAGRACGLYEPPRDLLTAIPGVELKEMQHNREDGLCCGSVLTLIGDPPAAHQIGDARLQEAVDIGVEDVVALCPCCQFQLRVSADKMGTNVKVHDLSHLVATAMGVELVDPTPYALTMWAVFEKMVYLMKPEAMASVMQELYPQMVDAMPFGMGRMMRLMGKVPGASKLMKPLMPKMFPLLMPSIMPKVMPDMLEAVGSRIDMPDSMREQMPDLLPQTMEALMPNMLPLMMPYVVPSMLDYLKNGIQSTELSGESVVRK